MTAATLEERQNAEQLNEDRAENADEINDAQIETQEESSHSTAEYLLMLGLAVAVDALGLLTDLSIFLAIPIRFITLPMVGILSLWRLMKRGKKNYLWGIAATGGVETLFSFLPAWTCFVLYTWFKDSKLGKSTIGKLSKATT